MAHCVACNRGELVPDGKGQDRCTYCEYHRASKKVTRMGMKAHRSGPTKLDIVREISELMGWATGDIAVAQRANKAMSKKDLIALRDKLKEGA